MSDYFQESQAMVDEEEEDLIVHVGTPEKKIKKKAEKSGERFARNGVAPSAPKKLKVINNNLY